MRKGQGDAGAPRWAVPTPGSRLSCTPSVIVNARGIRGDAGAPRPRPSPEGFHPSGLSFGGLGQGRRARRTEGAPGLRGSRLAKGEARRETCEAPPIRHGSCRDTFPSGEGFFVGRARAGLPYGRPASRGVVRSSMVEGGGDLLRRPTESTHAPPAMHRCGEPRRS